MTGFEYIVDRASAEKSVILGNFRSITTGLAKMVRIWCLTSLMMGD